MIVLFLPDFKEELEVLLREAIPKLLRLLLLLFLPNYLCGDLVNVPRACEMGNKSELGGGESIAMGEGDVITSTHLGFPSFLGHAGKSMEVKGYGNGG